MKKVISIFFIFMIVFSNIYICPVNAEEIDLTEYTIRQITNADEIKNDSAKDYILVYESTKSGNLYALAGVKKSGSNSFAMGKSNAIEVTIEGNKLTYDDDSNILWMFTKSPTSIANGGKPVLATTVAPYTRNEKRMQLKLSEPSDSVGINYVEDANGFDITFSEDGTCIINEDTDSTSYKYLRYVSGKTKFEACEEENATKFRIYEVQYNYITKTSTDMSSLGKEPTYPNPGSINFSNGVEKETNYVSNAVAKVQIDVAGVGAVKDVDLILILDESTSLNETVSEETDKTKIDVIKEAAVYFSETVLNLNPNNRIGIVKFGKEVIDEVGANDLGLSNDINAITNYINTERTDQSVGTDYTAAFKYANQLFEQYYQAGKDAVVVFLSDGAPTVYNRMRASVYKDGTSAGNFTEGWINYYLNTDLEECVLMKKSGVDVYTIGFESDKVSEDVTRGLLEKLANEKSYFYKWSNYELLEEIYTDISRAFYSFPNKVKVTDVLAKEVKLLTKTVDTVEPTIKILKEGNVIETITFANMGTEAYSSLNPTTNILTTDASGNISFENDYIKYNQNNRTITWNVGDLNNTKYTLEYFIYLTETTNLYDDGNLRGTGNYNTSESTTITYVNHLNENVNKNFSLKTIDWISTVPPTQVIHESGDVVKTGDNIKVYILFVVVLISVFIVFQCKLNGVKNVSKKK